ncbi:hypothetical protein KAR91_83925 [Candidatus Pacearchaeota archaeon]|nr:hypothetical protein [Candidatus Pacearchaeota archaeon]
MTEKTETDELTASPLQSGVSQIPVAGILGLLITGGIAPRWLCMSEEARAKYIKAGEEYIAQFISEEMKAKKSREDNDPFKGIKMVG